MKKLTLILLIFSALSFRVKAQDTSFPRITFGAEWSYISTFGSIWHYNFFSPEGYRVDLKDSKAIFHSNAEAYINAGYNFDENWNLSIYVGIAGIMDFHKAVPISLRGTYYFGKDHLADRWFTYMEAGSGLSLKLPVQEIFSCKAGGGYRLSLSRSSKIDFLLAVKATYTHPDIVYDDSLISHDKVNRNGMTLLSASLGMAVNF